MEQEQFYAAVIVIGVIFSIIKFTKGVDNGGLLDRVKKLEDNMINTTYRLNKIESDEDIVRREFLYGKLREIDRRIYDVKDMVNGGKGVSDGPKKG